MNFSFIALHKPLFAVLLLINLLILLLCFSLGELKPTTDFDYVDASGEGGITLMTVVWIFFILASRPAGRVTHLLFAGLTLTHISMLLDFLDEFISYPETSTWITTIESLPAPIGMAVMTYALYQWHQEQNTINSQLRRTERYYREHSWSDFVTGLYSAEYMKAQLKRELELTRSNQTEFSLIMLDIREFSLFNQKYGDQHGDNLLREIAQLILMNIRDGDLACRYAADRFIVLLPCTTEQRATEIANQITQAIAHLAYKPDRSGKTFYPEAVNCVNQYRGWHQYQLILSDLNEQLHDIKNHLNEQRLSA